MEKKQYRNSLKSEKAIKEAVISLLQKKKDFYSITVSDVCKESNMNRGTFYNHYSNIGEVANAIEDELMEEITALWEESSKTNDSVANFLTVVTNKLEENEATYKQLVNYVPQYFYNEMREKFLNEISLSLKKMNLLGDKIQAWLKIISTGIVSLYLDYFEGKSKLTLDEIRQYSFEMIEATFRREN
jgi:AcrR family transcriptional regulator